MAIVLKSKPGLSSTTVLNIPKDWDPTWFRNFISNQLKGADVRNAIGANGITVSGTIASPYATISLGPGPVVLQPAASPTSPTLTVVTTSNTQPAIQINESQTNTQGGLTFYDTNLSAIVAGIGIGAAVTGQGVTDLALFSSTNIVLGPGGGNVIYLRCAAAGTAITSASGTTALQVNANASGAASSAATFTNGAGSTTWTASILNPSAASGANSGLLIEAGRSGTDYPLYITNYNGGTLLMYVNGLGGVGIGVATGLAAGSLSVANNIIAGSYFQTGQGAYLMASSVAFTAGATGNAPTLTAGPVAGNPTKWIAIDDNGTVRHIPAW
jgi:hypothetical protein